MENNLEGEIMVIGKKLRFDIQSDNFDFYFEKIVTGITDEQKALLPKQLGLSRVNDGGVSFSKMRKLPFLAKVWILFYVFGKNVFITVGDNKITDDDVKELKISVRKNDIGADNAQWLISKGLFSIGPKEMVDTYHFINRLSSGPAYNYLIKGKNSRKTNTSVSRNRMEYIVRFLRHYEANKKKWNLATGVNMAEFYILIALYDKSRLHGRDIYHRTFDQAYQSSIHSMKKGIKSLQAKYFILKSPHKKTNDITYSITPQGINFVNDVIEKYAIDC